jgi:hypothetical protein
MMFKTPIILCALNFWVTECTPNPGWSFPHSPLSMIQRKPNKNVLRKKLQYKSMKHQGNGMSHVLPEMQGLIL